MSTPARQTTVDVACARAFAELYDPYRYKVLYGGRGGAKSTHVADALLVQGHQDTHRILCTREFQHSIRESVHYLLAQRLQLIGLADAYEVSVQSIDHRYNGTKFFFHGLHHNTDQIKSTEAITRCWVEEAHAVKESSWDFLIPTIREEQSEIWVTFNPRFRYDATSQRFIANPPPATHEGRPYSYIRKVSWRDNPWFPETLRIEMEQMQRADYEKYLHVWEGEYKTITEGAIFGKQITQAKRDNRVCAVPITPNIDVETSWDLGKNDATAIWWWQRVGKELRAIAYYENRGEEISHYCSVIKRFAKENDFRRKGIEYAMHYMPHDVDADMLGMQQSRKKQFKDGGVYPMHVVPKIKSKNAAIESARKLFPQMWFDKERCGENPQAWMKEYNERLPSGIDVLANYHYEYDEDRDSYKLVPYHDWASNGADALMQYTQPRHREKRSGATPQPDYKVY